MFGDCSVLSSITRITSDLLLAAFVVVVVVVGGGGGGGRGFVYFFSFVISIPPRMVFRLPSAKGG